MITLLAVDVYHQAYRFSLIHHVHTNTNTQIQKWCVILHLQKVSLILHLFKKVSIMAIDVL